MSSIFVRRQGGVKRYLVIALVACLIRRMSDFDLSAVGKVLFGPKDGAVEWEVSLLYILMAMLVLPEFVNVSWLHERLPNYILGFTLCLLFVLFDESVDLWDRWTSGKWKRHDTIEHHENLLLSLANLALFYANLKMHSLRKAVSQVCEINRASSE
mmetsp:Transcript_49615/g.99925  ORF Transcript_49615/g.99925 Transcript_49615/m.99925 type:complete len:156 (-) Transcript_49615:66-533(-)|eukprot:CAMPEP_0113818366 /NCGR_PEP_ID=MMETSP0328-20130328/204_1 /TAXON_ID=39455 /ORGANISM="Alexandrium minutum" /LENGTH=155 /DNA_ID=CAMNT_0000786301 /DNA_START=90 /DNA_END=557 /DNA_ORIENTATION=+ /assembly_acc=CAM_ASM_000350